jgi:putative isomerase
MLSRRALLFALPWVEAARRVADRPSPSSGPSAEGAATLAALRREAARVGQPEWQPMLVYVAGLHARSTHPAQPPFPHEWEEIGPGYCYGPAFGHWDIVHQILDVLPSEPEHARRQLLNDLANQLPSGFLPGAIWITDGRRRRTAEPYSWHLEDSHPPVWPFAADDLYRLTGDKDLLRRCHQAAARQVGWFDAQRTAQPFGYFYTDILNHKWESGVDEGIRFLSTQTGPFTCVDATSHVYGLCEHLARWSVELGQEASGWETKAGALRAAIQTELFDSETGFFHDIWARRDPALRRQALEGFWPVVVGAATPEQARRVIDENLLSEKRFLCQAGLSTVGAGDPRFELRMWRGPAWNSMTYWGARGCLHYGRKDAAGLLAARALDNAARVFASTGTVWEFYHPTGGPQTDLARKPNTPFNMPCKEYLGHNPLIALAHLYESARASG